MDCNPEISVIMSTYCRNYGNKHCVNFLKRALDSILNQTFCDFELILLDDGSIDGSKEICTAYARRDSRIKYYRFEQNSGIPAKRYNQGIAFSKGKFIAFMFDDDEWFSNALADLHSSIIELPTIFGMVYGIVEYHFQENLLLKNFGQKWSLKKISAYNMLSNNSVLIRRAVIDHVGGYDEARIMRRLCDWDLWLRIAKRYKVKLISNKVGYVTGFLSDSIGNNISLNHYLVYARQMMFFRRIPLRKHFFPTNLIQWKHYLLYVFCSPIYIFFRYVNLGKETIVFLRRLFIKNYS